jgi:hypothetical protein
VNNRLREFDRFFISGDFPFGSLFLPDGFLPCRFRQALPDNQLRGASQTLGY